VERRKFSVFVMVSELLERAEERRDGTEKDFLRFWKDGHEKKWGDSHFLYMAVLA